MSKYRHAKKPGIKQIAIIAGIAVAAIALIVGIVFAVINLLPDSEKTQDPTTAQKSTVGEIKEVPTEPHEENPDLKYSALAKKYLDTMTSDEKIYQMLLVSPESLTGVDQVTAAGEQTKTALTQKPVGGILYTSQNFENDSQSKETGVMEMISNTKSYASTPLFIATQEEGGENSPLATALGLDKPDNASAYATQGEAVAFKNADTIATYLAKYGFNMNFAPFMGLSGNNSFSQDPATAGSLATQSMLAYQSKSIVSVVNSFPDANETDVAYDSMKQKEFVPFVTAIDKGADTIMVSTSKALSIHQDPAFMADIIVKDILKDAKDLGFNGLVITAPIAQSGVDADGSGYIIDDIVTSAIHNGVNMFVCPRDIDLYYTAIKNALDKNIITQAQIDECVTNILKVKFKYGIIAEDFKRTPVTQQDSTQAPTQEATQIPSETATETLTQQETAYQDPSQYQ